DDDDVEDDDDDDDDEPTKPSSSGKAPFSASSMKEVEKACLDAGIPEDEVISLDYDGEAFVMAGDYTSYIISWMDNDEVEETFDSVYGSYVSLLDSSDFDGKVIYDRGDDWGYIAFDGEYDIAGQVYDYYGGFYLVDGTYGQYWVMDGNKDNEKIVGDIIDDLDLPMP
ncbi:MAG: hypothetical protein IKN14_06740, partial [Clostridiales bacterium]|nr:hypothetical protein [Clostridiales bacterium]